MNSYTERVFEIASSYKNDFNYSYDTAMCECRKIAAIYGRPWEWVAQDFEIACDEVVEVA